MAMALNLEVGPYLCRKKCLRHSTREIALLRIRHEQARKAIKPVIDPRFQDIIMLVACESYLAEHPWLFCSYTLGFSDDFYRLSAS